MTRPKGEENLSGQPDPHLHTVVLDLERDELGLQRPFGGRAVHTDVEVGEDRE